jgi:transposase
VLDKHIRLPKLGLVKCRISRQVEGRILSATVSHKSSGKYFVSITCTDVVQESLEPTGAIVSYPENQRVARTAVRRESRLRVCTRRLPISAETQFIS